MSVMYEAYRGQGVNVPQFEFKLLPVGFVLFDSSSLKNQVMFDLLPFHIRYSMVGHRPCDFFKEGDLNRMKQAKSQVWESGLFMPCPLNTSRTHIKIYEGNMGRQLNM